MKKTKINRLLPIFIVLTLILACQSAGRAVYEGLGGAADPVPFMEKARTGTLPSGLRYYILENSRPENRAFLTLAVDAGSVLETEEERGLAHFVEHMAFNGTERFPGLEVIDYLRSLGMRFGPEINAYTSFDSTVYGIETPVETVGGIKIIPDRALEIIDDWTKAITFETDILDNERLVIMEEYRSRLGASDRLLNQMLPILFKGSPYADRLPIGLPEVIENAPPETLIGFFNKWYRADNMALIFVGDFDGAALEASLQNHFHISAPQTPLDRPRYDLAPPKKGNFDALIFTDPELTRSRVDLYYKQKPEALRQDLAAYRGSIITYLTQTMLNYRFDEAASKPATPYTSAGSGYVRYGYSSRFYALVAEVKPYSAETVLRELFTVKEQLARYGFTEGENELARRALISYLEQLTAEKDYQNSNRYISYFTDHFLEGATVPDVEWELEVVRALLPGISLREINQTVKKRFDEDDLLVFVSAPESEKDSLPTAEQIKAMAAEYKRARIARPQVSIVRGDLIDRLPSSGRIVAESIDAETGAFRWILSNGAEVILKETANRGNEISFFAQARGGTASLPIEMDISATLAAEMINVSGLGPYSRSDLTRVLADKQVSFSFWAQSFLRGFQGGGAAGDITTLFEMIYLGFTQPRLDPEAVEVMLDNTRTMLIRQVEDPFGYFSDEIYRTLSGNTRFHPMVGDDIDKASMEDAMQFIYACSNPADYTFVFAGNIDINTMRSLVETYLASIPAQEWSFNDWDDVDYMRPRGIQKEVRKGKEEQSAVFFAWFAEDAYTEEGYAASAVLEEYLNIVLIDEIREKIGGVYSIWAGISHMPFPHEEITGQVYFVCDPRRVEELSAAVEAILASVAAGTIDRDVFGKAVEALIKTQEESLQRNMTICNSYANSVVIYNSPLSRMDNRIPLYRSVTTAAMQRAAARLFSQQGAKLILFPED